MKRLTMLFPWLLLVAAAVTGYVLYLNGQLHFGTVGGAPDPDEVVKVLAHTQIVGDKIVLDDEAYKLAGISIIAAKTDSVGSYLHLSGEVQVAQDRFARVNASIPGNIREILKLPGDTVSAGTPLCVVEAVEVGDAKVSYEAALGEQQITEHNLAAWKTLQAAGFKIAGETNLGWAELDQGSAEYLAANAEAAVAQQTFTRMKDLVDKGLRTQSELITLENELTRAHLAQDKALRHLQVLGVAAENDLRKTSLQLAAAARKLRVLGVTEKQQAALEEQKPDAEAVSSRYAVTSPVAGTILQYDVTVGRAVDLKDVLYQVADLSEVWVQAVVREQDVLTVHVGMPVRVRVPGRDDPVSGVVGYVGQQIDERTRTLPLRIVVKNVPTSEADKSPALRPGMFVQVDVETARKENVVMIPLAAVQQVNNESCVFTKAAIPTTATAPADQKNTTPPLNIVPEIAFGRREVKLGLQEGDNVEVLKGLTPGEEFVLKNSYLLKSEWEKAKMPDPD